MAIIKSAWELALEKTEGLQIDSEKIKSELTIKEGRQIAAALLNDIDVTKEETAERYHAFSGEKKKLIKEGMALTLLSNLTLPRNSLFKDTFSKVLDLGLIIADGNEQVKEILGQLEGFFTQYLENQDDLIERLKTQFEPHLKQKEAQLRAQYGPNFTLRPEQDAEFMKILDQQLSKLDDQYTQILTQAKEQINELLGLS
ncbi:MAG TPA: hypothetical protein PLK91_07825 [Sphaerochaeta sp.]|jgi:hypothetical protein|nr:hypothetical protein [Sphaerochaeta sp.]HOQ95086.1 hypothetical protein [Sphaerochaeta sp.]HQB89959.1 hypothetical protein [Sphaerochaeta sp.]